MKAIICELCGSQDIIKQDGFFVCQSCGTKYSPDEARKLMGDAPVAVTVDNSGNFDKYVKLARDAMEDARYDAAYDNFSKAVEIKPDDAECVLGQGVTIFGNSAGQDVPPSALKCVEKAVKLFADVPESEEKDDMVISYMTIICSIEDQLTNPLRQANTRLQMSKDNTHYEGYGYGAAVAEATNKNIEIHNANIENQSQNVVAKIRSYRDFRKDSCSLLLDILSFNGQFKAHFLIGGFSEDKQWDFKDYVKHYPSLTLSAEKKKALLEENPSKTYTFFQCGYETPGFIKMYVDMGGDVNITVPDDILKREKVWTTFISMGYLKDVEVIKELVEAGAEFDFVREDGSYLLTNSTDSSVRDYLISVYPEAADKIGHIKQGGCYVATAVYGSYDCPEVWTLRRYRDETLAETRRGRAFIRTYYAISPTLVKWFGGTRWFTNLWKPKLDRMVSRLNAGGVENTPYDDKQW